MNSTEQLVSESTETPTTVNGSDMNITEIGNSTESVTLAAPFGSANVTLQELNDQEFYRRLAPVIYLAILMVIGIPGNSLVLYIYTRHIKKSVHRTFILALALADITVCLMSLPFEITEMRFQYTFYAEGVCKYFRANNNFLSLSSIFLILGMSIDRYRRICGPLKIQLTVKMARYVCISAVVLALILSWPNLFLSGTRRVKLEQNITGFDCSLSDVYAKTKYPFIYNALLFLVFLIVITSLIVLYACIGKKIYFHGKFRRRFTSRGSSTSSQKTNTSTLQGVIAQEDVVLVNQCAQVSVKETENNRVPKKGQSTRGNHQKNEKQTGKITRIAFTISLVFILSYLPHLLLSMMTAIKGGFVAKPSPLVSALLPIVTRSIFINNVANPIIYGFFDNKFRGHCKSGFLYLCTRK